MYRGKVVKEKANLWNHGAREEGGPEQEPDGPGDGVEVTVGAEATRYQ